MRTISFIVLMIVLGAMGIFAVQNNQLMTLKFLNWSISCPFSLLAVIVYLLGMVSGWSLLHIMRLSLKRVSTHPVT